MKPFRLTHLVAATLAGLALHTTAMAEPSKPNLSYGQPELRYAWSKSMWHFRTRSERQAYLRDKVYTKAPLQGIKVDAQDRVYVSVSRILDWRVPATLNRVVMKNGQPVLEPFPSWEANRLGQAGALQNVLGFDIDSQNRMWILDMGFAAGSSAPASATEQKIVVIDLNTGEELKRLPIPASVADPSTSFLNDIALDEHRQVAYISDTGLRSNDGAASGIVVYDLQGKVARRVLHRAVSTRDDESHPLEVNHESVFPGQPLRAGINGIALTPDGDRLYWSITSGNALYSIETRYLNDPTLSDADVQAHVEGPVRIGGGSDAISMDSRGRVYITNVTTNQVQVFDPATKQLEAIASGEAFIWPDSLGWDRQGGLWVSTNHLNHVFAGKTRFKPGQANFRLFRIQTDAVKGHAYGSRTVAQ
ncbi:MAG: hypothetical protein EOP38_07075 [Rubrivivax sp.]|nr:MAG: hypothetical protein EOP38_07075 [Rubrivivax sp.]